MNDHIIVVIGSKLHWENIILRISLGEIGLREHENKIWGNNINSIFIDVTNFNLDVKSNPRKGSISSQKHWRRTIYDG